MVFFCSEGRSEKSQRWSMVVVRLVTYDGPEVPVDESFIRTHLDNGVFPRLLGWNTKDGLTTPEPSRDSEGRYTILKSLGVSHRAFLGLLRFLRMQSMPDGLVDEVVNASLCVGGVDALDAYMRNASQCPPEKYNPMKPDEDTLQLFRWATMHMSHSTEVAALVQEGWSVTAPMNDYILFFRKKT